jgi:hypothetical protein
LDHLPQNATGSSGMSSSTLRDKRIIPPERDREVGNDAASGDISDGPDGSASMSINTHLTQRQSDEPSIDGTHSPQSALSDSADCSPASSSPSDINFYAIWNQCAQIRSQSYGIDREPLTERYSPSRFRSDRDQDLFHSTPSPADTGISHEPVPAQYHPDWDRIHSRLLARAIPPDSTAISEENSQSFFSGPSGYPPSTWHSPTPVQRSTPSQSEGGSPSMDQHMEQQREQHLSILTRTVHPDRAETFRTNTSPDHSRSTSCSSTLIHICSGMHK